MTRRARRVSSGIAAGLAGGLIASWVMDQFQAAAAKVQQNGAHQGEQSEPATVKAAEAVSEGVADHQLTPDEKKVGGPLMHYLMGGASGAIYGAAAALMPESTLGAGTAFGAVLWLVADEIAVPAFGLSKKPTEVSAGQHFMALASHLVYGAVTDGTRRVILSRM